MLDSATAEVLEEEANSTEAPDHVPAAIAKLTPDPAVRKFDFVSTRGTLMGVHLLPPPNSPPPPSQSHPYADVRNSDAVIPVNEGRPNTDACQTVSVEARRSYL